VESRVNSWKQQIADEVTSILVNEVDGEVCGFIAGGECRDEDLAGYSEVYAIYVSPQYQGAGVGTELLTEFFKVHRKPSSLWVLSKNEPSMN